MQSLRSNQLSDVSGPTLAEMVKKLPCLEELDLAGNRWEHRMRTE